MVNGTQMTLDEFFPEIFQEQTVGASDSPVRTSPSVENNSDLRETAQACFSELCTFLDNFQKKKNPLTCSLRTLKICCLLMADGISPGFSLRWIGGGTMRNGRFSTLNISECHRTGSAVLLSDILEDEVPKKYFLSKEQTERIVFTESDKWGGVKAPNRDNPQIFRTYDPSGIAPCISTIEGGHREPHTIEVVGNDGNFNRNATVSGGGISPTITARDYKGPVKVAVPLSEILTHPAKG